jgi:hypothetical protein
MLLNFLTLGQWLRAPAFLLFILFTVPALAEQLPPQTILGNGVLVPSHYACERTLW